MAKKNEKKKEDELVEEDKLVRDEVDENVDVKEKGQGESADNKKDEEIEKLKDQLLRQVAEYDNYRKRTAKERMELEPEITAKVVSRFLPVIDNLERAINAQTTDEGYKKGVEMINQSFISILQELGVEEIATEGVQFDPSVHQAVQQVQSDELESGVISQTFQKGYKLGDKVIRFAMVAVVS